MSYRVKVVNPATSKGFVEGYRTARRAKEVVAAYQALYRKEGSGLWAEYLGKPLPHVTCDPELRRRLGL